MASIEELARRKSLILEQAPEQLANEATRLQKKLWSQMTPLLNSLETDATGNIVQSDANIRKIGAIIQALNVLLTGDEYRSAVTTFLKGIDENIVITDEIAKNIEKGFSPSETQKRLVELVKSNALNSLVGNGLRSAVSQPFAQQLIANVAARAL